LYRRENLLLKDAMNRPIVAALCLLAVPVVAPLKKPIFAAPAKVKTVAKPHPAHQKATKKRVIVAGILVGGMNQMMMTRRLQRALRPKMQARVALSGGATRVYQKRSALGIAPDIGWMIGRVQHGSTYVPLRLRVDQKAMTQALRRLQGRFNRPAIDARLIDRKGRLRISSERSGQTLIVPFSVARLKQQVESKSTDKSFRLAVRKIAPQRTRQAFTGINGRLASFGSDFNPAKVKRTLNMRLAIRSIHGHFVAPGKLFSLNDTVGARTQARGYRTAIVFENGRKSPGIGGGVSQVTGTLFNAALVAGLPIVTYQTHSRPVAYLPLGRDATVSWGDFDMKWKNNTSAPIYISYQMAGSHISATLYGHVTPHQNVRVKVVSHKFGARRIKAQLWRVIRRNGKVVSKQKVGGSDYNWKADNPD
jgi:vancomycin resistance protein YoaR